MTVVAAVTCSLVTLVKVRGLGLPLLSVVRGETEQLGAPDAKQHRDEPLIKEKK